MPTIFLRTLILYVLLTVLFRCLGKRQVGELDVSELISTLLLSEIASLPIDDPDIPLLFAVVPILLIGGLEVAVTFVKTKVNASKGLFESQPIYLIREGVIDEAELARNRMTVEELLSECRQAGYGLPEDVNYAILEPNGQLSVLPKAPKSPLTPSDMGKKTEERGVFHPLVIDGVWQEKESAAVGLDRTAAEVMCRERHYPMRDLLLLGVDDAGHVTYVPKTPARQQGEAPPPGTGAPLGPSGKKRKGKQGAGADRRGRREAGR